MKLVKIKLINWHIFSNNTIELNGNTLITGENASGKSTLIDAIYYVLSGGDHKHFNKAANEMGKRDLESYLRGKLGSENHMFLRSGVDIIGYVILEFVDNKNKNHLVLGSELEIVSSSMKKPNFFVINNYSINDDDFIKNKQVVDYRSLKLLLKSTKHPLDELPDTIKDRKRAIGRDIFKLDNYSRFFELLEHAISFKPIPEVSSFVNGFLLDEGNINLDNLRGEIRSYQNIHRLLIKENEKINALKDFVEKAERYVSNIEKMNYFNVFKSAIKIDKLNKQINRNMIEIERLNSFYNYLIKSENCLKGNEERIKIELYQLKNNEAYKALQEKKDKLKEYENKLFTAEKDLKDFLDIVNNEQILAKKLKLNYRFDEAIKEKDFGLLKARLENYRIELDKNKLDLDNELADLRYQIKNNNCLIQDKKNQLDNLKKGINNYPNDVLNLIEISRNAIKEFNPKEKNIEVRPLCEYIEIKDEKWTNALEGYLNTQRFNLIIEPKYYDVVTEAYNKYKNERKVFISGIVNVNSIPSSKEVKDSMMNKIVVSNKYARRYVEYLLSSLVCVDDVMDLKKFDASITPEVMIYKNHVLKACKPEVYKIPYIGKSSREKRLFILEQEIKDLSLLNEDINNKINIKSLLQKDISKSRINEAIKFDNYWSIIDLYKKILIV